MKGSMFHFDGDGLVTAKLFGLPDVRVELADGRLGPYPPDW
jgi:hypothetical protein